MAFGRKKGKVSSSVTWPENVTISSATDVGTNRPYLATANTTSEASAAGTGGAVTLTFSLPAGSASATNYTITSTPSTYTATATSSPYTFQGLASNTAYTFTIRANNSAGSSSGTTSASVTATTVPNAPGTPTVTSTVANQDVISWAAPVNGGKAITGYTLKSSDTVTIPTPKDVGNVTSFTQSETGGSSQFYNVLARNANGNSAYSPNSSTITTFFAPPSFFGPPSFFAPPAFFGPPGFFSPPGFFAPPRFFSPPGFFSPPSFFSPPGFFAPPRFFSPPMFACIDEDTLMLTVGENNQIIEKPAKEIAVGDKLWSLVWDEFVDESKIDPYTWSSNTLTNISMIETDITGIIPSIKDVTIILNNDMSKRFSLEQTVLIKKGDTYFFGTTGVLEIGDVMLQRNQDGTYTEVEITSTQLIDEERTVYQFQASPYDILIAGDLAVHNAKGFA